MARDDRQRRRGEGRKATSGHRRRTHWRRGLFHHGPDESRRWAQAVGRLEAWKRREVA